MIKKFIKICGTGKFLNYNHSAVPAPHRTANFEKINLLYGENGSGKTTLSIILKSLKDNNGLLLKKISFDKTFPQTVEVLTDVTPNPKITFVDNVWDIHYPNLEIFDIYFVNENIYTGLEIQNSHKKNLFEIILGQQGIQLKNDIQQIKDKIQSCNTAIRETTEKIQIAIDEAYNADAYCLLSIDPDIVDKIAEKEREIITATNYQEIQAKTVLSEIQIFTIPYDEVILMAALSKSIDTVSDDYLLKFNERKEHLSMDAAKAEEWIKQGYEAIIDDSCPFCLRPFDATTTEIVEAYRQYFSMEYNSLLRTLSQLNLIISSFNVEAQLLQIEAKIISNQYLIEFWKNYIVSEPAIASIIEQKTKIQSAFETVQSAFKEKLHNPLHAKDTSSIVAFREIIGSLNSKIADFNLQITDYNLKIVAIKLTSPQNITHLESDLKKLRAIKKRGNAPIETLCSSLLTNKQTLGDLRSQKDTNLVSSF